MFWSEAITQQAIKSYAIDIAHTNKLLTIDQAWSN